jgi:ubiquinone/menaquinone biosynthesis C-methylase UbiE
LKSQARYRFGEARARLWRALRREVKGGVSAMASTELDATAVEANEEAIRAWDGPLFDRFLQFKHLMTDGLGVHGDAALELLAPQHGERALDIGCGFGDTTEQLAALIGPESEALGVDAAPRFIEHARAAAAEHGVANARFMVADVQTMEPRESYDIAFSRFGTMFFANPVAAMRNVRRALSPGGRLVMTVWRNRADNDWIYRAQTIVEGIVERPTEYDEPTCGPGPFSMADADTTSAIMLAAGFHDVALHRCDLPILIGRDLQEAIALVTALGPAGEILRLAGDRAAHLHAKVQAELERGMSDLLGPDGVRAGASTWLVSARVP